MRSRIVPRRVVLGERDGGRLAINAGRRWGVKGRSLPASPMFEDVGAAGALSIAEGMPRYWAVATV